MFRLPALPGPSVACSGSRPPVVFRRVPACSGVPATRWAVSLQPNFRRATRGPPAVREAPKGGQARVLPFGMTWRPKFSAARRPAGSSAWPPSWTSSPGPTRSIHVLVVAVLVHRFARGDALLDLVVAVEAVARGVLVLEVREHEVRHVPARAARVRRQKAVFRSARLPARSGCPGVPVQPPDAVPATHALEIWRNMVPEHETSTSHVSRGRRRPFIGDPLSSARARTSPTGVLLQTRSSSPRAQLLKKIGV